MTDLQHAARTVMTAKVLADVIKAEGDRAKSAVDEAMTSLGVERLRVTDDTGVDAGTLTRSAGRTQARVVDESAFVAWVAQRYPQEMVRAVRASFRERLLFGAAQSGDAVDPQGEPIPGVEVVAGSPYVSCRPAADARRRMRELLAESGLLSLRSGSESDRGGVS